MQTKHVLSLKLTGGRKKTAENKFDVELTFSYIFANFIIVLNTSYTGECWHWKIDSSRILFLYRATLHFLFCIFFRWPIFPEKMFSKRTQKKLSKKIIQKKNSVFFVIAAGCLGAIDSAQWEREGANSHIFVCFDGLCVEYVALHYISIQPFRVYINVCTLVTFHSNT